MDQQRISADEWDFLSSAYSAKAERCFEIANYLNGPMGNLFWQSPAANRFRENTQEYILMLHRYQTSFTALSQELHRRSDVLRASEGQ